MNLTVSKIERIWVDVPFREIPRRNMIRELPHWTLFEICQVTLACGVQGWGETMVYYTWGAVSEEAEQRALGRSASELMWDDALGAGLQMALFDAVAKALEVPIHHLLGKQMREQAFISWWSIDMPPEDWRMECHAALRAGYTSCKFKARPWFDLHQQLRAVTPDLPAHFDIDLDFNTMLNNSALAVRVCKSLEQYEQIKILESPIPQGDVAGNKYLRAQTSIPLAMHVGNPPLATALKEDVCDGFVVCAGASQILFESQNIAAHNKMFWLQLVGTGITTTWGLHLAAVSSHARWPAISCQNLYEHTLLKTPLEIKGGMIDVPTAPGLGVELDWDMVEKFRIEPIAKPYPYPDLLMELTWPSGQHDDYAHGLQYWHKFLSGLRPVFSPDVMLKILPNDGSAAWRDRYAAALRKPSWDMRPN